MRILAISTGLVVPLTVPAPGGTFERVPSAIRKTPVSTLDDPQAIALETLGFRGDEQADHTVHGGREKAVYAYPVEHYPTWQTIREQATKIDDALPPGFVGENLTIEGLLETRVWIGDVLVVEPRDPGQSGDGPPVRLRVDGPRYPCFKFNARMGFNHASKMMVQSGFSGFYLEVLQTGTVRAGDSFRVVPGAREVTIDELFRLKTKGRTRT